MHFEQPTGSKPSILRPLLHGGSLKYLAAAEFGGFRFSKAFPEAMGCLVERLRQASRIGDVSSALGTFMTTIVLEDARGLQ